MEARDEITWVDGCVLKLEDGSLVYESLNHPMMAPSPIRRWRVPVSPEALARFWHRVDALDPWRWGDRKQTRWEPWGPGPGAMDGRGWSVELRHGARGLKLQGYNEFPARFDELRAALETLAGRDDF